MTFDDYMDYVDRVNFFCQPCVHGHLRCADRAGGRCLDEIYSNLPESARVELDGDIFGGTQ